LVENLEITTTACAGTIPLEATYQSFQKNLLDVNWASARLYINVDPVPKAISVEDTLAVARKYFPNIEVRTPDNPCFPAAVKWLWQQPKNPYFLHLEWDWELMEPISIHKYLDILNRSDRYAVNFQCYGFKGNRPCLLPGFWKTNIAKELSNQMSDGDDPEKQVRRLLEQGYRLLVNEHYPEHKVVKDIGREWRKQQGYEKNNGMELYFTHWTQNVTTILTIGILTTPDRKPLLDRLMAILTPQLTEAPVQIIIASDNGAKSIGLKRTEVAHMARGLFLAYVDDDDRVSPTYVKNILDAIAKNPEASHCSLKGVISTNGAKGIGFEHSIEYKEWRKVPNGIYERTPNHLNAIRTYLVKRVGFPDINHGEDRDFSTRVRPFLNKEAKIEEVLYYYDYVSYKPRQR